jgi:hypothetical protein
MAWLDEHLGRDVSVALRGPPESRVTIDSRGGELHGYDELQVNVMPM